MALDFSTLSPEEQVTAIFVGYYDRAPAVPGLNAYVADLAAGQSPADVARSFVPQDETLALYPSLAEDALTEADAIALVTDIFNNLFNRDPSNIGPDNFWVNKLLTEEGVEVGQVILDIMSGATGDDLAVLENKIEVGLDYVTSAAAAGSDGTGPLKDAILDNVTGEQSSVDAAKSTIADTFPPAGTPGEQILLTSGTDAGPDFTGTENDDDFLAYIQQNPFAGGVSNSLASADRLDGGAGNDRLYAELSFEFLGTNNAGLLDIQPRIKNIEEIDIEARDFGVDFGFVGGFYGERFESDGPDIIVDAKNITDVEEIGSYFSDGDLKIENLTTLTSGGDIRNTSDITVTMVHTDNYNSDGDASDLTVLFDNDYLLAGQTSQGAAEFFLLDEKAELARLQGETVEGRLDEIDKNGIRFEINGVEVELFFDPALIDIEAPDGETVDTHQQFVDALQAPLAQAIVDGLLPSGTSIELVEYDTLITDETGKTLNRTGLNDGTLSELIPAIRVESGDGSEITALGFVAPDEVTGAFDVFGEFRDEFEQADDPVSIDIDLEKAGRGGEGGNLIVGGKADSVSDGIAGGIEVFNINVIGGSEKPSWIGALNSTLDALDTVNVSTDANFAGSGDVADLTIGEIGGNAGQNGGETDVRVFDSTDFEGNLTAFANLDEMGNGAHSYLLGAGDDNLTIVFGDVNNSGDLPGAFGGEAGDSLVVNTGAGDDTLIMDNAPDGEGDQLPGNPRADLEFLHIETGAGDDVVFYNADNDNRGPLVPNQDTTAGDGARISTGSGDDRIYMNDGDSEFNDLDFSGLGDADNFQLFEASLQFEMDGVLSEWVDISYDRSTYTTSREDIRDAIIAAVEGSSALSGMIEIVELADGGIRARSLVSDDGDASTFRVDIEGPVASVALIDDTSATANDGGEDEPDNADGGDAGWELLNAQPTLNQVSEADLAAAWNAWYPGSTAFSDTPDWSSDGGNFGPTGNYPGAGDVESISQLLNAMDSIADVPLTFDGTLFGTTGNTADDTVINGGAGDDLIILSTNGVNGAADNTAGNGNGGNGNTVEFTDQFGWDTIVNFTPDTAFGGPTTVGDFNNNDILDFTSYLDAAAAGRGVSVGGQDDRVDDDVAFTFINDMGVASAGTDVDHNQIRLMDFSEIWNDLEADTAGSGSSNFDSLTAGDVDAWLELTFSDAANVREGDAGGADANGLGNTFLVLVGKDGDIEINPAGDESFDPNHADNQFWAFEAVISNYDEDDEDDDNYDFTVSFLGGVDLAETDITALTADDFGVTPFV